MSIKGRIGEAEAFAQIAFDLITELSDALCCVDELFDDQNAKHILDGTITMIEDKRRRWEEGLNSNG